MSTSKAYDLRSQVKTRVAAQVSGLDAADIIIERQQDFLRAIDQAVAIASNGVVLTILPNQATNQNPDGSKLFFQTQLTLSLWTRPVLAGDMTAVPEEVIHEDMMEALHHYELAIHDSSARQAWQKLKVLGFREVPDPEYLRRDTFIECEFLGLSRP